jgi:hypothetical protein
MRKGIIHTHGAFVIQSSLDTDILIVEIMSLASIDQANLTSLQYLYAVDEPPYYRHFGK